MIFFPDRVKVVLYVTRYGSRSLSRAAEKHVRKPEEGPQASVKPLQSTPHDLTRLHDRSERLTRAVLQYYLIFTLPRLASLPCLPRDPSDPRIATTYFRCFGRVLEVAFSDIGWHAMLTLKARAHVRSSSINLAPPYTS